MNCSVGGMKCSFSCNIPILPLTPGSISEPGPTGPPQDTNSPSSSSCSRLSSSTPYEAIATESLPSAGGNPHQSLLGERYGLLHFTLLHHFESQLGKAMGLRPPEAQAMTQLAVREACTTPFLMDELLALSAAHKSTLPETGHRDYYRIEATRLQTRALTQFNAAKANISEDNCVAAFLFSTFLGQHVLFDTFSSHGDLAAILEKFVQCLILHRGIAAIAGDSWPAIRPHLPPGFGSHSDHQLPTFEAENPGTECAGLLELLDRSELSPPSNQACRAAVEALQRILDSLQASEASGNRRFIAVQEWPVRVPKVYIDLLAQRRPEALAILAYYAVLAHRARDFWIVGDAGRFLIQSITQHLGAYWADWLEWPKCVLAMSGADGSQEPTT